MFNLFKKTKKDRLSFVEMFPSNLSNEVLAVNDIIPEAKLTPQGQEIIIVNSESLKIYDRIYNPEPAKENIAKLSETQRLILNCIYTRHHDGHVRGKYLKNILSSAVPWVTPYVLILIGEYVEQILMPIKDSISEENISLYRKFAAENPSLWNKIKARVVSYWNVYYRDKFINKEQYPGVEIIRKIEEI
jgi:hypothetical protein